MAVLTTKKGLCDPNATKQEPKLEHITIGGKSCPVVRVDSPDEFFVAWLRERAKFDFVAAKVIEKGRAFQAIPRPTGIRKGRPRACYLNALTAVLDHPRYRYCEGFVLHELGVEIHHAWVVDKDDNAVEVTYPRPAVAYFGVAFSPRQFTRICRDVTDAKMMGSVLEGRDCWV